VASYFNRDDGGEYGTGANRSGALGRGYLDTQEPGRDHPDLENEQEHDDSGGPLSPTRQHVRQDNARRSDFPRDPRRAMVRAPGRRPGSWRTFVKKTLAAVLLAAAGLLPAAGVSADCSSRQVGSYVYTDCYGDGYSTETTTRQVGSYVYSDTTGTAGGQSVNLSSLHVRRHQRHSGAVFVERLEHDVPAR